MAARAELNLRLWLAVLLAGVLGLVGFLLAGTTAEGATHQNGSSASVSLRTTKLGAILVNTKGHTLYLFTKDKGGRSSCTGTCATYWPAAITRSKPTAGTGLKAALLGTTTRSNGSKQLTYNHHPLYTFALDKQAGQTSGQSATAFGGRWWAVSAGGGAVTKAPSTATTTTSGTTTSGTTTSKGTTTSPLYP
jgi:predicted lipoprotein with Yx(FWY)xxD motif